MQLMHQERLKAFCAGLEAAGMPFVLIKGADLAFRVYPQPALRRFVDWDVWVQKRDVKRLLRLLADDHWQCELDVYSSCHCGPRFKDGIMLEPQFALPNMFNVAPERLWRLTEPVPGRQCQRQLGSELNLLMLFQHNSGDYFQCTDGVRWLLDVEFVLRRTPPDWEKLGQLAGELQLPHPGLLLAAFPEFFRERYHTGTEFAPEAVKALRELLLEPHDLAPAMAQLTGRDFRFSEVKRNVTYLRRLRKGNLTMRYPGLARRRWAYGFYLAADVARKLAVVLLDGGRLSSELKRHLKLVHMVADSWKTAAERKRFSGK